MRPLRLKLEDSIQRVLRHFAARSLPESEECNTSHATPRSLSSILRQKRSAWKHQYQDPLLSVLTSDDTRAIASRVVASGLAQGCIGFSLTIAAAAFNRLTEARSYYISRVPRPLHPPKHPVLRPALEQGLRATTIGVQSTLIDEVLIRYRGEDKAASNAFWSGFLVSVMENRKGGTSVAVEEGLKGGTTSWLFHMILGGAEEPTPADIASRPSEEQHEETW